MRQLGSHLVHWISGAGQGATEGSWREGPSLNVARIECLTLSLAGRLWTFGGASDSAGGESYDTVESIGPGETAWRVESTRMPVKMRQFGGCVLNGKAYLCGGIDMHDGGKLGPAPGKCYAFAIDR